MKIKKIVNKSFDGSYYIDFRGIDNKGERIFGVDATVYQNSFRNNSPWTISFGSMSCDIEKQALRLKVINKAFKEAIRLNKLIK